MAAEKKKNPTGYQQGTNAKILRALGEICLKRIPQNPGDKRYRQGVTLGEGHKHWFRDKFGNGRFRVFFRFDSKSKVIVYAWVNDQNTLRTRGSKTDAYAAFTSMLNSGNPPNDWSVLLAQCSSNQHKLFFQPKLLTE